MMDTESALVLVLEALSLWDMWLGSEWGKDWGTGWVQVRA